MKKVLLSLLALLLVLGGLAYQNQTALMLALVKYQSATEYEIGPPREIPWNAGPETASAAPAERPPNIILIVADDLGYNDISTFGGGVAGGRVQTPHIDQLAAEGVAFTQSYSGAGTCAVSRAMLMTGRYPTRTGFEFTPTPSGMAPMVTRISAAIDSGLPPSLYDAELDSQRVVDRGLGADVAGIHGHPPGTVRYDRAASGFALAVPVPDSRGDELDRLVPLVAGRDP